MEDLHWLAGFLEGEGSFGHYVYKNQPDVWKISFRSTDYDVAVKAATIMGVSPTGPYMSRSSIGKKAFWQVQLRQRAVVIELARTLQPLMGQRRQSQIQKVLDDHDDARTANEVVGGPAAITA